MKMTKKDRKQKKEFLHIMQQCGCPINTEEEFQVWLESYHGIEEMLRKGNKATPEERTVWTISAYDAVRKYRTKKANSAFASEVLRKMGLEIPHGVDVELEVTMSRKDGK